MPCYGRRADLEELGCELVACAAVDEVDLWVSLWRAGGRMDVVTTEVLAVLEGVGDGELGEVLVAEGDDFALGDEAGELVFASVGQGGELNTLDGCANSWSEIDAVCALWKKVFEAEIGILAVIVVLKRSQRTILLIWIKGWEVVGVLNLLEPR